ncbi:hypothetical protein GSB9_01721 [Flavobacteriaceae bacterium GSB9]|nr:hypothetical protein GSB9_01721 [Flavobacteriaceae bacterium GSB9]
MCAKFKVLMPCDKANHVCDKTQYRDASLREKLLLNIHLVYCKACRGYSKNNRKLTKAVKVSKVDCLDKNCKEHMKKELDKAIKEQSA